MTRDQCKGTITRAEKYFDESDMTDVTVWSGGLKSQADNNNSRLREVSKGDQRYAVFGWKY